MDHQVIFESQNPADKKRVKSMHKREVSMGDVMPDAYAQEGKEDGAAVMEQIDEDQPELEVTAHEIKEDDILDYDYENAALVQSMFASSTVKDEQTEDTQLVS